jgi:hypothetical protein
MRNTLNFDLTPFAYPDHGETTQKSQRIEGYGLFRLLAQNVHGLRG